MLMVKDELVNTKKLLSMRIKTQTRTFIWFFIVMAIMLAGGLVTMLFGVLKKDGGFQYFYNFDYSVTIFIGVIIGSIIVMLIYRQINAKFSVFPQTNNSRYISSLLINYFFYATAFLAVLVMYLINLGAIKLLSTFRYNIHLALKVDASFIVTGYFVYLAYIFIIVAAIELVGTILRKWTYYAAVAFTTLLSLGIINIVRVIDYAPRVLAFLIMEPSLPVFFVKAAALWLALTVAALIINRCTVYYKSQNKAVTKRVVIICAVIATSITIIMPIVFLHNTRSGVGYMTNEFVVEQVDDYISEPNEIRIDISQFPRGSNIGIKGTNITVMREDGIIPYNSDEEATVIGADALNDIQGDTAVIRFQPNAYVVNGIEISHYANPRIEARIDGDMLYLDYIRDSANIVYLPIWEIVRQFDCFKGRDILAESPFMNSSGWYGSTNIYISVE